MGPGGAERVVSSLCNALQASGRQVSLWTFGRTDRDFYQVDAGVRRIGLGLTGQSSGFSKLFANFRRVSRLRVLLREERPDVLVSFITQANITALFAAAGLDIPVVISERVDPRAHIEPFAWRLLRRLTYRRASFLVVQTRSLIEWGAVLAGKDRVVAIPNPVPKVAECNPESESIAAQAVVGMGRLVHQKGFDLLLEAFVGVKKSCPNASLTIYGEGPDRPLLLKRVKELGLDGSVSFPGYASNALNALMRASVFVLSSRYEGFPNVLVEAMSAGRVVVAFDCPSGPAEIIRHEIDGLLVPPDDVRALEATLVRVLSDSELRIRLSERAAEVSARFSMRSVLAQWLQVLERAVRHAQD